jgi:hypothetical protein
MNSLGQAEEKVVRGPTHWTKGVPQIATKETCALAWSGGKNGKYFRCSYCGHQFVPGDYWRWVYTNDLAGAGGNPMTCRDCDTGDNSTMRQKWKSHCEAFNDMKKKFWNFLHD